MTLLDFGRWSGLCVALVIASSLAFAEAAPEGGAPEPTEEAVLASLPFETSGGPTRIVIDLAPEGSQDFPLMLDTGAAGSILTPGMARKLGVSIRRDKSSPYRRKTVLGRDLQFWIDTQSSDTGSKTGFEYGLLGGDFLSEYVVEIDYPGRTVRFLDPKKYEVPKRVGAPDEAVLEFDRISNRIRVPCVIDGREVAVLLDTGAPATAAISGKAAKKAGLSVDDLPELLDGGSVVGKMDQQFYEAESFQFAGFELGETPLIVFPHGIYNLGGSTDSLLGYDILRQFVMRIDYDNERIWLKRTGDTRMTYLGEPYQGKEALLQRYQKGQERIATSEIGADGFPTEESAAKLRASAEASEQRQEERFEQAKQAVYAQDEKGNWMRVEGYRLRKGPQEGEAWVSFEEMQAIKAEQAGQ